MQDPELFMQQTHTYYDISSTIMPMKIKKILVTANMVVMHVRFIYQVIPNGISNIQKVSFMSMTWLRQCRKRITLVSCTLFTYISLVLP